MANYYVYCDVHKRLRGNYPTEAQAQEKLNEHLSNQPSPHGTVSVIEEKSVEKYGQSITNLVKVYTRYKK